MIRISALWGLAVLALAFSGCGSEPDRWVKDRPATAPAGGVVTYRGQPLPGAVVVFQPQDPGGIGSSALTDEAGKFSLQTFPPAQGAVPGKYAVLVMKTAMPEPNSKTEGAGTGDPLSVISLIPAKYSLAEKSGLTAEIPETGIDSLVLELND